ncbi:riboflavin biosynthesis protein [Haloferula helveola]|uniref:Riboflavin biosynthesis protein n=1 Tax=Haloferula helveola TaxID=490095 RepID=A0ABM7RNF1_9BACT|nr:riboflavin biosynthesis protein [Haloferula helveola]
MQRLSSISELAALEAPVHLALGVFDGVHLGHQAVIAKAVAAARASGGTAGVLTFDPYPLRVLAPEKAPQRLLASLDHKASILEPLDVDFLLALPFDRRQASVEAEDFVSALVGAGARTICAGEDWRFGHKRSGDSRLLGELAGRLGFRFEAVPPVMMDGERISSTRIRQAIRDGNLDAAAGMLGRPYTVAGTVIEGRKLGRELGFPTANLERGEEQYPPDGVWAVRVSIGGRQLDGVANLGIRPTIDGEDRLLEVHCFDVDADFYGQTMEVEFVRRIRGQEKFGSLEELKQRIGEDRAEAMYILRGAEGV